MNTPIRKYNEIKPTYIPPPIPVTTKTSKIEPTLKQIQNQLQIIKTKTISTNTRCGSIFISKHNVTSNFIRTQQQGNKEN
jgi:hypothetical protein